MLQGPLDEALKNHFAGFPAKRGEVLLAAVSGGADSLALLAALQAFALSHGCRIAALHCDHGLRGRASAADAAFVKKTCKRWRVPLVTYHARGHLKALGAELGGLEELAREWRLGCYAKAIKKFKARRVFLGHHAVDQAETFLLNVMRGAGLRGAAAMRPEHSVRGVTLARPLLEIDPKALRAFLKGQGIAWREDPSNLTAMSRRNVLRHQVLPLLERILPGSVLRLSAFTRRLRDVGQALNEAGLEQLKRVRKGQALDLGALAKASAAMKPLLLALWLGDLQPGLALDEAAIRRVLRLAELGQGRVDLKQGFYAEVRRKRLYLRR